jgi:hypothetical protein
MPRTAQRKHTNVEDDGLDVRRAYVSQTDVPRHTVNEAVRVAMAINDNYGKQPTKPLRVAEALRIAPTTGKFRNLASASVAYGLTEGTAWASEIALTELGRRVVSPTKEGADAVAKVEAALRPRVIREFLVKYDGSKFPPDYIAVNVLAELGVPRDAAPRALAIINRNAEELGLLRDIKGNRYVDLANAGPSRGDTSEVTPQVPGRDVSESMREGIAEADRALPASLTSNRRVFITHGRNQQIVAQLKELLSFGNFEPVVAIESETSAKPVPDKVLDEMRSCGAAIVHVGAEQRLLGADGVEVPMLNPNVLIEIGAAMALYGRRFILLVEKGVTLPSNLLGLYEVRFEGARLDYEATMKLLKAFNDFRT